MIKNRRKLNIGIFITSALGIVMTIFLAVFIYGNIVAGENSDKTAVIHESVQQNNDESYKESKEENNTDILITNTEKDINLSPQYFNEEIILSSNNEDEKDNVIIKKDEISIKDEINIDEVKDDNTTVDEPENNEETDRDETLDKPESGGEIESTDDEQSKGEESFEKPGINEKPETNEKPDDNNSSTGGAIEEEKPSKDPEEDAGAGDESEVVLEDYPVQEMMILSLDDKYIGSSIINNSKTTLSQGTITEAERWKLKYISEGVFNIVNVKSGKYLAANADRTCSLSKNNNSLNTQWKITGDEKDMFGNFITYKIESNEYTNLVITSNDGEISINEDTNLFNQRWLLNSAGLQGFAGSAYDNSKNRKACNIGGALGEVVYVSSVVELQANALLDKARTIVITKDLAVDVHEKFTHIDADENLLTKIKVGKNKTIIGAYGTSLTNIYFYLDTTSESGNFILKNLTINHSSSYNLNNFIPIYISKGVNFWIDHCTLSGHTDYKELEKTEHSLDKLMYVGVKADYVTVSDTEFNNHEYGLILGYPSEASEEIKNEYTGYPRMTIANCAMKDLYCRAPGLMRYGYFHTLNNYITDVHLAYTLYTNSTVYAEGNYYENINAILDDKGGAGFKDINSNVNVTAKVTPLTSWNPESNYKYKALSSSEVKEYCEKYSGAQSLRENFKYASLN